MQLADIVQCRSEQDRDYGVVLLPEGLIEFVPEVGILIAEINEILARSPQDHLQAVTGSLTPASSQVAIASRPYLPYCCGQHNCLNCSIFFAETWYAIVHTLQ